MADCGLASQQVSSVATNGSPRKVQPRHVPPMRELKLRQEADALPVLMVDALWTHKGHARTSR